MALIDSGVLGVAALDGPGKLVRGADFSEDAYDPDLRGLDTFGHGSHMAGVIVADDPETGYKGVAPGARLVSVKVAGADGITSLVRVLMALDWVRRNRNADGLHIRVLNLSLGVDARRPYVREPLAYAAEQLWIRGITVVAAAGNQADGTGRLDLPAADPFLIAVAATDTGTPPTRQTTRSPSSRRATPSARPTSRRRARRSSPSACRARRSTRSSRPHASASRSSAAAARRRPPRSSRASWRCCSRRGRT